MRSELAFSCYGAQLRIVDVADTGLCGQLAQMLPPSITPCDTVTPDACFVIDRVEPRRDDGRATYRVVRGGRVLLRARRTERVVERLRREVDEAVALFSRCGLFVHAGVVGWRGRAVVVPGRSMSGKSHLIAELVRLGATYYSDEFAVLDDAGIVHPYARAPVIRGAGAGRLPALTVGAPGSRLADDPLPLALIVSTLYRPTATWQPEEVRGARAVLPIIDNTVLARSEPAQVLRLCARIAPSVVTLQGLRPDAAIAAPRILEHLNALLDGHPPARSGRRAAAVAVERARATETFVDPARQPATGPISHRTPRRAAIAPLADQDVILLLHWNGRFGNRMHQYAYGVTYARLNACRFWLPSEWEGTHLFETQHHELAPHVELCATLNAAQAPGDGGERPRLAQRALRRLQLIRPENPRQTYRRQRHPVGFDSVCAYHPAIFAGMSRQHLLSVFQFSEAVRQLDLYKRLEDRQGTYDIAHLRRDDISNPQYNRSHTQGYSVISRASYLRAFAQRGCDPGRIEWISDDYRRQWHVDRPAQRRGRWTYPTGSEVLPGILFDWLEDFLRLYFARTIFRANSSFSWWAAFLSPCARVFSPIIDKQHIYGVDGLEEIEVDFVEGNHPHWMFNNPDIVIGA